jgi:hypothetical protein
MPDNRTTRDAIAKANGRLARAKADENKDAAEQARQDLKTAIAEYDKD